MISPRIKFEVGVRILGGLMALGYEVGAIMKRRSRNWSDEMLDIKIDWIEGLDRSFTQIQGKVRCAVEEAGKKLGLEGTYIPHSYIEQVQLEEMTDELRQMSMEMKDTFVMAANRGYDGPRIAPNFDRTNGGMSGRSLERSNSGMSAGRGRKEARSESVTRLQDMVRRKRSDSFGRGGGGGSDNGWGSNGGEQDPAPGAGGSAVVGGSTPMPRISTRVERRSVTHHGPQSPNPAIAGDFSNDHSGEGSGAEDGEPRFYGGYQATASPCPGHDTKPYNANAAPPPYRGYDPAARYSSPATPSLEGRLNVLTQRVEDLAQAHMRFACTSAVIGGTNQGSSSDAFVQSQMLLAKLDTIAASANASARRITMVSPDSQTLNPKP
jgi:hypothetical protein